MKIKRILIQPNALAYLKKRNLSKQYKKAKRLIIQGHTSQARFKKRKPYSDNLYYFRINKQYRAIGGFIDQETLLVTHIDDHS